MESAKPLIIVLAILVVRVKIVLFALKTLAVNMDTATNRLNAIVNQVGLDHNVKEVKIIKCSANLHNYFYLHVCLYVWSLSLHIIQ